MEMFLLFWLVLGMLACRMLVQGQDPSNPGFISIDCGSVAYNDTELQLYYQMDDEFIDSGENKKVSANLMYGQKLKPTLSTLRVFPNGTRNCYTIPAEGSRKYLIRASFLYGNYDGQNQPPTFDLHIGVTYWATVKFAAVDTYARTELIHVVPQTRDAIQVCLINTDSGTPLISSLELRQLSNDMYETEDQISTLLLNKRVNIGSKKDFIFRHPYDAYDRIWMPDDSDYNANVQLLSWNGSSVPNLVRTNDPYQVPTGVLETWVQVLSESTFSMDQSSTADVPAASKWIIYFHFAELSVTTQRKFTIYSNNKVLGTVDLNYLVPVTVRTNEFTSEIGFSFRFVTSSVSSSPPILNALEVYRLLDLSTPPTNITDVRAMNDIKKAYSVTKESWQGDPCVPSNFTWDGVNCSTENPPRITSLNLSFIGLKGDIADSLANLTALKSLDLSHNQLTGSVPKFLAELTSLQHLDLSGNNLRGSVPKALQRKANSGALQLHLDGNPKLCKPGFCGLSNTVKYVMIIGIVLVVIFGVALAVWIWKIRKNKRKAQGRQYMELNKKASNLEAPGILRKMYCTPADIKRFTRDFEKVIGEGGYGKVYLGRLDDNTEVAVKMLSSLSTQGADQFKAEANSLLTINHKNLVPLLGYCNDPGMMALIYEYQRKGSLQQHLPPPGTNNANLLTWDRRLNIAVDIANGLDYLHNHRTPQIIHRDIKPANILLDDMYQAKISDFGLSKIIGKANGGAVISNNAAGTPGYADPAYWKNKIVSTKSDVYSFGVVLLQLITGRHIVVDTELVDYCAREYSQKQNCHKDMIDQRLDGQYDELSVIGLLKIAMSCVTVTPADRPDIGDVLKELKECRETYQKRGETLNDQRGPSSNKKNASTTSHNDSRHSSDSSSSEGSNH